MEPAGRLERQAWMTARETRAVTDALAAGGAPVRFIGGCVRDAVAGRPVKDIDLATPDPPEVVMDLLQRAGLKAVPTGVEHGTVTAVAGGRAFEVTTLRVDVETFGRHAKVAFTDDWLADAARRDLTINAMSCAPDGTLYDPFGGREDLAGGRIRFVGDARERIREDYLRLLRFFRFHAHYGRGDPDPDGLAAATELAPALATLSAERLRSELLRLLEAPDPAPLLEIMIARQILAPVLPEAGATQALARLISLGGEGAAGDPLLRLAALVGVDAEGAERIAARLRLSNAERARLTAISEPPEGVDLSSDRRTLRRALYRRDKRHVAAALVLLWARDAAADRNALTRALAVIDAWDPQAFALKGRDVLDLGIARGPAVGRLLDQVEAWWIDQDFRPSRDDCLARLRTLAQGGAAGSGA